MRKIEKSRQTQACQEHLSLCLSHWWQAFCFLVAECTSDWYYLHFSEYHWNIVSYFISTDNINDRALIKDKIIKNRIEQMTFEKRCQESLLKELEYSVQFSSVTQSCLTLCDPLNRSTPGLPVHHQLPEFTQTHVHRVNDAIQPSHPLSSPSPPATNPSQHQILFQWVNSSYEVAIVL